MISFFKTLIAYAVFIVIAVVFAVLIDKFGEETDE